MRIQKQQERKSIRVYLQEVAVLYIRLPPKFIQDSKSPKFIPEAKYLKKSRKVESFISAKELMKKWKTIWDNFVRCHRQMTQTETGKAATNKKNCIYSTMNSSSCSRTSKEILVLTPTLLLQQELRMIHTYIHLFIP